MLDTNEAVIVATARTPIGRANKGSLVDVRADEMLANIMIALMEKVPQVDKNEITDIIAGNVAQTGETGFSIARTAGILAGFPLGVPGLTINRFCSSSLQSVRSAAHAIQAGEGDIYVACGVEKSSRPPAPEGEAAAPPARARGIGPGGLNPKLLGKGAFPNVYIPMGMTAENVAVKYKVSREDQDAFAALSQQRAVAAQEAGVFDNEITPVTKEDGTVVSKDDGPRPGTTKEKLAQLVPVFKKPEDGGTVTAGNACPLNDGAAAVLVMSRSKADQLGIKPLARVVASEISGNDPEIMGVAPIDAVGNLLRKQGMTIKDVDVVELNEAFAAQVLPVCWESGIDIDTQLNPHGGAIALGHPFGMTGARIMTALINDLQTLDKTIGIETMCAAGGMAMAMMIERLN
ncbi:MAG: 3-ketoacyl-CoA thiolase @ Acetyl-CoA acetyltransferase [uncultured Acidimicrobiales bacterium]|uniref:3-ketoacyl-CoA thiolase @ Acetyl-CoA acetyltransferase n=1 Tax=uncultured Acidimicrobiales bacterium TaxID=310071 RepID=A0A6J4IB11_9ACTN|nr:MAG: 3-ketoacyl-CoA thiolase @ Acetyl-CoA acetyltransferase [uncultured Acidimicrobiales bacterium]